MQCRVSGFTRFRVNRPKEVRNHDSKSGGSQPVFQDSRVGSCSASLGTLDGPSQSTLNGARKAIPVN